MALVDSAFARLGLSEVWVIPAGLPVHRHLSGQATPEQRLVWMQRIFAHDPRVTVIDWEVRQSGPVSSLQTLKWMREQFPEVLPLWLMGADAFAGFPTWKDYPEHRHYCNVAVFARAGETMPGPMGWSECDIVETGALQTPGHVIRVDAALPDISATELREGLAAGRVPEGWLPGVIADEVAAAYGKHEYQEQA